MHCGYLPRVRLFASWWALSGHALEPRKRLEYPGKLLGLLGQLGLCEGGRGGGAVGGVVWRGGCWRGGAFQRVHEAGPPAPF